MAAAGNNVKASTSDTHDGQRRSSVQKAAVSHRCHTSAMKTADVAMSIANVLCSLHASREDES
jgi:hypothetical protein